MKVVTRSKTNLPRQFGEEWFLNSEAAAKALGLSVKALRCIRNEGYGPSYIKYSNAFYYYVSDLSMWLDVGGLDVERSYNPALIELVSYASDDGAQKNVQAHQRPLLRLVHSAAPEFGHLNSKSSCAPTLDNES